MKAVGNRNTMAATLSLTQQLSSGNPIYDKYYRQVDPTGSGRVAAADAALFLKRSGLADLVLGKIWDLADSERKGSLNKQQFFIALRLVACAQNGLEVALKSLNVAVPPPKFHDTSSPLLAGGVAVDIPWVVKPEEKLKFDSIFDSLGPVGGILTGDKVKPVLLNSKLPVDILGRVWELSDIDRDGMLDRDEFSVAMYLVYRALEGEPVPMSLPPPLVPPSKRKKPSVPPVMPLLPSPPSVKDSRSSHAGSKTMPHPPKPAPAPVPTPAAAPWVVSPADKAKYDELFSKTDGDMDGLVSGPEVRDIFLKTGLPSATLARIWELCDIGDIGKLTREQFALALHLINQKLTKGLDPPQSLSSEMIPPSDRQNIKQNNVVNLAADFSAIKELDSLSNEIVELQREKSSVEDEIKEKEEAIRQRSNEVQDLQDEVARESEELQRLQAQRQKVQDALEELDQQKGSLEEQLTHIRQQTNQETQLISSLQSEHEEQEQRICQYEEELVQAREELLALQEESRRLQEKVQAAQEQLTPLQESVRDSFTQVAQASFLHDNKNESKDVIGLLDFKSVGSDNKSNVVQQKLNDLQVEERSVTAQLSWKRALEDSSPVMVNGSAGSTAELYQGDPFQQDLFQEDQPKELKEEEPAPICNQQKEHSDQKEKEGVNEREEEEEKEDESPKTPEEEKLKPDPLDDLYTSLASGEIYNNVSILAKPQENTVREHSSPTPEVSSEVVDDSEESPKESPPKVASPEPESKQEPAESPETTTSSLPPQVGPRSMPPQTSPPSLPEIDFFHSDPFTDHDPFKDDLFGKTDVADPFGGDPFKGSDPFAADSFFVQTSSAPFSSDDPFSASADPFGTTTGVPEPDLFAAKLNDAATPPAAGPDPFTSKPINPAKDPFSSTGNNMADSDPFGGKNATGEADPFGSQDGGTDPFSSSSPSSDLAVKDTAATNDPFAPGGTTVNASSDPDPFAAVFGNESFGGGFADFSALTKSNGADQFGINNKNLFQEDGQSAGPDVPPALPPKTGTPTRPPPPPPGKRLSISKTESSDSFQRRGHFLPQPSGDFTSSASSSSLPAKDPLADPFAPSSPPRHNVREADRFASFDKQWEVSPTISNRGRHDRVGKARERARGKGATCQAHPAGTRRPGAGHRTQQV
ncbi:epidermal growth factor receptor substrate 15 isoform X4 [Dicentrarchus labrax]|uniref:epidermal growth factor receptor substrate 15 isoform X4 n=1 Tax=Dicentrarchus labrax TaxID=13489 RepID=UPI0021F50B78|nr:epidermal growth factor receptor substrate 15 isoform X4 [Dicentrarchus labrax]